MANMSPDDRTPVQQTPPVVNINIPPGGGPAPKDQIPGHPSFRRCAVPGDVAAAECLLMSRQTTCFTSMRGESVAHVSNLPGC